MDNLNQHSNSTRIAAPVNPLLNYVQSLDHEVIDRLSHPTSPDVEQVMEHHITGLLGHLPGEGFHVAITTNREHLSNLLSAAMMNGYFLRAAEQRMAFEHVLQGVDRSEDVATPEQA